MGNVIIENNLKLDVDAPYCKEGNKIDVYTNCSWTADSEEEYQAKEKLINDYKVDNELFELFAWCDSSGYEYWVVEEQQDNYVSVDVNLKKQVEEYTDEEIQVIRKAIEEADCYFVDNL